MTDIENKALAFANTNKLLYIGLIDGIKNYGYKVIYADDHGVMCRVEKSNLLVIASDSLEDTKKMISSVNIKPDVVFCLNEHSYKYVGEYFGFSGKTVCTQGAYLKDTPVEYEFDGEIKTLDASYSDFVCSHYDLTEDNETKERVLSGNTIGAFTKTGELAGFIGIHTEGTLGMLLVMPEHRRKGIAYALEAEMTNRVLREGRIPWCHIVIGNDASTALQKKLGFTFAHEIVYWLY